MDHINPIIEELLHKRGITGEENIKEFLSEKPQKTYDPFLLPDLEAGVDLLLSAAEQNRRICIYGDYDADGITSVAILMEFLGSITNNLEFYIPSRFDEGYGLNADAVRKIREGGADVLVTVDCGSVSYEEVELAKELGMGVLVTDHHSITDVRADCLLINPKREDSRYPFSELAGCGVAFKLAQGIQKKMGLAKTVLNRTLDLAALGTIADVVPLLDENRTLVKYGMRIISSGVRPGLAQLIDDISLKREKLKSDHISFGIAPHLNAAGRMGDASIAASLLLAQETDAISSRVEQLIAFNSQRKKLQEDAYEYCKGIIEDYLLERKFLLVYAEGIHEGIAGIVAGKLKELYERPVILLTPSGEYLKGTGRSITGLHLYQVLKNHEELFLRFGGHAGACGFLMERNHFQDLDAFLEEDMQRALEENPQLLTRRIESDMELEGRQVTLELAELLECLEPFGSKNPKPIFQLSHVTIARKQPMGDGRHIRFLAECRDGCSVECVLFNKAKELEPILYGGQPVDLTGCVDLQEWKGNKRVQFMVDTVV